MRTFTIELPDRAVEGLEKAAHTYNGQRGGNLSVQEWITLHLRELSIGEDLGALLPSIQEWVNREHQEHIAEARDGLLRDQDHAEPPPLTDGDEGG